MKMPDSNKASISSVAVQSSGMILSSLDIFFISSS